MRYLLKKNFMVQYSICHVWYYWLIALMQKRPWEFEAAIERLLEMSGAETVDDMEEALEALRLALGYALNSTQMHDDSDSFELTIPEEHVQTPQGAWLYCCADPRTSVVTPPALFLDYDGVLHQGAVDCRDWVRNRSARSDVLPFEWSALLVSALEPYAEVRIILANSWLSVLGCMEARACRPVALRARVFGCTLDSQMSVPAWHSLPRYSQIVRAAHKRKLDRWLAIDDDAEGWPDIHRDRLVLTDNQGRLNAPAAQKDLAEKLAQIHSSGQ